MKNFTVLGFYESNGQIYSEDLEAESSEHALRLIASSIPSESREDLQLVAAVECVYQGEIALAGNAVVSAADYLGEEDSEGDDD